MLGPARPANATAFGMHVVIMEHRWGTKERDRKRRILATDCENNQPCKPLIRKHRVRVRHTA